MAFRLSLVPLPSHPLLHGSSIVAISLIPFPVFFPFLLPVSASLRRSATLEDQERHLLVKVIDRMLYKLDYLIRPYVHKILIAIEPMLIDEDYYARVEGREIISNLAKAAGLATMIATMRPDIDDPVRPCARARVCVCVCVALVVELRLACAPHPFSLWL